jgi:hypothetical protein
MGIGSWICCVGEVVMLKGGENGMVEWIECKDNDGRVGGEVHEADSLFVVG